MGMQFFNINLINIESAYADFKLYKIKKEKKGGGGIDAFVIH